MDTYTPPTQSNFTDYLARSISYQEYKQKMTVQLSHLHQHSKQDPKMLEYLLLNQQRMKRVEKTFLPSESLLSQLHLLPEKVYWLVISEPWCGDAAQSLPVLEAVSRFSAGKIDLRLVYRDQNLELMDAFFVNGSRAIPRLVQLDCHYQVTGTWGPRPAEAQTLVQMLKSNPATAETYGQHLHKWYAQDKQQAIQAELHVLLQQAGVLSTACYPYASLTRLRRLHVFCLYHRKANSK